MNLDAELETEGVGPVFGSAKKQGFEPWQHRRSCLGQGAVFRCGEPQWGDADSPIFVPFNVCSLAITKCSKFGTLTKSDTGQVYYMCHNCPSKIRIRNPAFKPLLADLR